METKQRLIDAIVLISKARRMETTDNNGIPVDTFAVPVLAIEDAPTVDAVEVVHGRWENPSKYGMSTMMDKLGNVCSACASYCDNRFNFCPHCGAKMDGGADNG